MTYYGSIDATPLRVDWMERWDSCSEETRWDPVPPEFQTVAAARAYLEHQGGDLSVLEDHDDDEPESASWAAWEAVQENDPDTGCPMMNYAYPLDPQPFDPHGAAALLWDLPVVIVALGMEARPESLQHEGRYVLALSGGGMDLSWEICEAYRRLDYHPPIHFMPPPRLADWEQSGEKFVTLVACVASAEIAKERAEALVSRLADMTDEHHEARKAATAPKD